MVLSRHDRRLRALAVRYRSPEGACPFGANGARGERRRAGARARRQCEALGNAAPAAARAIRTQIRKARSRPAEPRHGGDRAGDRRSGLRRGDPERDAESVAQEAPLCQRPLYRQAQIYSRQGVDLDRSTLADWVGRAAALLAPLQARLFEILKASPKLFADETRCPVLDPGRKRVKR